jgi:hypothetical protein
VRPSPSLTEPERVAKQRARLRDTEPRHTVAFTDAVQSDIQGALYRLIPVGVQ